MTVKPSGWERRYVVVDPRSHPHRIVVEGTLQDMQDCFGFNVDYLAGEHVTPEMVHKLCDDQGFRLYRHVYEVAEIDA